MLLLCENISPSLTEVKSLPLLIRQGLVYELRPGDGQSIELLDSHFIVLLNKWLFFLTGPLRPSLERDLQLFTADYKSD